MSTEFDQINILVVDDEESIRDIVTQVLEDDGHTLFSVPSAEKGLEVLSKETINLVITDIRMDGMDGIELLEKIKANNSDIEVIIMTSHASLETSVKSLRAGAFDYLMKPFDDIESISAIVNRVIEKLIQEHQSKEIVENLKDENKELNHLAQRDGLTQLYNHRYFKERFTEEVSRANRYNRELSLIFLDVDHFKIFNDRNGHPAGDTLLKILSKLLQDRVRNVDIVARYGGEEFVIVLPETHKKGAMTLANSIRKQISEYPFTGRENQPDNKVTVSVGIATYPNDGMSVEALIKKSDDALYLAKRNGRNRVCSMGVCIDNGEGPSAQPSKNGPAQ